MKNSVNSDRSATRNAPPAFPPPQNRKARILVVDDHPLFRLGLVELINAQSDLAVCGEAGDAARAFEMAGILHPDIVVTDLSLKEVNGLELIKNINASYPRIRAVVLSMHDETLYAERALRAGSYGYMMKEEGAEMVLVAIRRALAGEIFVSDRMKRRLLQGFVGGRTPQAGPALTLLSDRELEVFSSIGKGQSTREIAEHLRLSVRTVEAYREYIKEKLCLKNGSELVQHAFHYIHESMAV